MSLQYHLKIKEGDVAPYVLLPGDPKRVPIVASYWDEAHFVADNREHVTYTGVYKGVPISCTSTGMGCPSTAIAMEELARCCLLYTSPSLYRCCQRIASSFRQFCTKIFLL